MMPADLSPRLAQILELLGRGKSFARIASELGISIHTVGQHARELYLRLGVHCRWDAVDQGRAQRSMT